jgi:hypothetical protein
MNTTARTLLHVLQAALISPGLLSAASAANEGIGATSTASARITVTVAARGQLSGLGESAITGRAASSQPVCLWLNTAVGRYTLSLQNAPASHELSWTGRAQTTRLHAGRISDSLLAARRPGCAPEELARLDVRRVSAAMQGEAVTLLIAPE